MPHSWVFFYTCPLSLPPPNDMQRCIARYAHQHDTRVESDAVAARGGLQSLEQAREGGACGQRPTHEAVPPRRDGKYHSELAAHRSASARRGSSAAAAPFHLRLHIDAWIAEPTANASIHSPDVCLRRARLCVCKATRRERPERTSAPAAVDPYPVFCECARMPLLRPRASLAATAI